MKTKIDLSTVVDSEKLRYKATDPIEEGTCIGCDFMQGLYCVAPDVVCCAGVIYKQVQPADAVDYYDNYDAGAYGDIEIKWWQVVISVLFIAILILPLLGLEMLKGLFINIISKIKTQNGTN